MKKKEILKLMGLIQLYAWEIKDMKKRQEFSELILKVIDLVFPDN
ncbi:MAG: hypothetical protein WC438_06330 [Candidatus Pacearchaeota archaeon]